MRTKLPEKFMYTEYHLEDARQNEVVLPSSFCLSSPSKSDSKIEQMFQIIVVLPIL